MHRFGWLSERRGDKSFTLLQKGGGEGGVPSEKRGYTWYIILRLNINAILLTDHVFPDVEAFFIEIKVNS